MAMAASLAASPAGAIQPPSEGEAADAATDTAAPAEDETKPADDQSGGATPDEHAGHADHESGHGGATPAGGSPDIPPLDDDSTGGNGRPDRDPVKPG